MGFFKNLIGLEDNVQDDLTEEEIDAAMKELRREEQAERKKDFVKEESKVQPFSTNVKNMAEAPVKSVKSVQTVTGTGTFKVIVVEPKSFDECPKIVDYLKGRRPIIINLEKIETETAKKIFDFLSGATYALNGTVQKVANNIFIFAPESVDVATIKERTMFEKGINQWER